MPAKNHHYDIKIWTVLVSTNNKPQKRFRYRKDKDIFFALNCIYDIRILICQYRTNTIAQYHNKY